MAKTRVFELISAPWTRARLETLFVTVSARNPAQCLEADRPSPVRVFLFEGRAAIKQAPAAAWH